MCSQTLRKEQRQRVFKNRAVRRTMSSSKREVQQECGDKSNELHDLYALLNAITMKNEMGGSLGMYVENEY